MSFTRNLCDDNNGSVDEELGFSSGTEGKESTC